MLSNEGMRYFFAALALALIAAAAEPKYRAIDVGPDEALHLKRTDRREEIVQKEKGQTAFTSWAVSPDHRTVGWLALYPNPFPSGKTEVPLALTLFRNGIVVRRFTDEQAIHGWGFRSNGRRVAYCDGPPDGSATRCLLRDVETGKTVDTWEAKSGRPPLWAEGVHGELK